MSRLNPQNEWQVIEVPELRIIDQDLWDEVKARQAAHTKRRAKVETTDRNKLSSRRCVGGSTFCPACWNAGSAAVG
ncbi:hypothetical protein SAMN05444340_1442 [Citreimonas salinaria]|uniref:Uncharacterized protein n=1 Tax=Citreimonas salinaria TaxID=321339 RepID=A0A1H3P2A1_9RHOB|nr:hypothetical protein SAMN05444340_1442 [Citreimonas salinaria]